MINEQADAAIVQPSLPRKPAIDLALKHRLPLLSGSPQLPREGGLMSYSINQNEMYRRAAFYVDRILRGAKPADLPVEQPTKFELVVNLEGRLSFFAKPRSWDAPKSRRNGIGADMTNLLRSPC